MRVKTARATFKTVGDAAEGIYEAFVSVFDNKDTYGDVVRPKAFTDTLDRWSASGNSIPVVYSHMWGDPTMLIGKTLDAAEKTKDGKSGLWTKNQLFMDEATPATVYQRMKDRVLSQHSFAYDIVDGGLVKEDGDEFYELRKLDLFEHGPCLLGVNQETETLPDSLKSGFVVDEAMKALVDAVTAATRALESAAKVLAEGGARGASADPPDDDPANAGRASQGKRRQGGSDLQHQKDDVARGLTELAV